VRIFQKRLIWETAVNGTSVIVVTVGIFTVVKMLGLLRRAVQGHLPPDGIDLILILKLMTFLDAIITPALFISILLVLIRWNKDNEITIYATAGIGPTNYLFPSLIVALLASFLVGTLSLWLSPVAERIYAHELNKFRQSVKTTPFKEGHFRIIDSGQNVVYFSNRAVDESDFVRLFYVSSDNDVREVTVAKHGSFVFDSRLGSNRLQVSDGTRYRIPLKSSNFEVTQFESYEEIIPVSPVNTENIPLRAKSTRELFDSGSPREMAELHWRISKSVTMFVVVFLAFVLGSSKFSSRTSVNLVGALFIYFVYSGLLGFLADLNRKGVDASGYLLWATHGVVLCFVAWTVVRTRVNRRRMSFNLFSPRS